MTAPTTGNVITIVPAEPEHQDEHEGQARFAHRLAHSYTGQLLHAHSIGWHQWENTHWTECRDGATTRAVLALVREALTEVGVMGSTKQAEAFLKEVRSMESAGAVNGVLALAGDLHPLAVAGEKLDPDRELLNTTSGTVQLTEWTVRDHNPGDHITKVTNAAFNADARSEMFDEFLMQIQPDPEMRAFLSRSLGSALLGKVRDHVLLIWRGTGANGKGTLRDAVRYALGDYAVEVPPDILLLNRHGQQQNAPERMRLRGARLAFCSEIDRGAKMDEAIMKKLTGGDPVNACLKYKNPIEFDPSHTLVMLTNHLPQVRGDDPAVWRRILAVPFDVEVKEDQRDGELPEKLQGEADAILAWLWAGWLDYQKQGLNPPQAVLDATKAYREDMDLLARFLGDTSAVTDGHGQVRSAELYRTFTDWCHAEGEEVNMTNKAFSSAMEQRGYRKARGNKGAVWHGICVPAKESDMHWSERG